MARKRPRAGRKRRTREHVIADLSVHHVEGPILRAGFTVDRIIQDYGLDLRMTTYNARGEAEPDWVQFQVKATDHLRLTADGSAVVFRAEAPDVAYWLEQSFPVILVVYDARADMGHWLYVQAYFRDEKGAPKVTGETVTLHVPTANVLDEAAVRRFAEWKAAIGKQMKGRGTMYEGTERVHWTNTVRYRDLWRLLRRRGYDCDRLGKNPLWPHTPVRICGHEESESFLALAEHPPDQFVHPGALGGVRLELANFGLMTREEFNSWVKRRAKANAATNGAPTDRPARRRRASGGPA